MAVLDAGATFVVTLKVGRLVIVEVVRTTVYFVLVLVGVGCGIVSRSLDRTILCKKTHRRNSTNDFRHALVVSLGRDCRDGRHALDGNDHRARSGCRPGRGRLPFGRVRLGDGHGAVV